MRKRVILFGTYIGIFLFMGIVWELNVRAERAIDVARRHGHNLDERYQPAGSIISEINTGQILWQENAEVSWAPASMTKLMTILVAYDAMAEGMFGLDTEVPVTQKYVDISGRYVLSNNVMKPGAVYTVSELIDLIIVPSSAAATYMLADLVEPDPDKFVGLMNEKARSIGMAQTTYYNSVGIPNQLLEPYQPVNSPAGSYNVTSPMDYALLCSYFIRTYPDILNHTDDTQIVVKPGTPYEEHFTSYQISLEGAKYGLEGTDGLKTGSSGEGGFNYSSTAKRGDTRLIEVVMGVSTWADQSGEEIRHLVGNAIMEDAFAQYEYRKVLAKGTHTIGEKEIFIKKDFWDCVPKDKDIKLVLADNKVKVDLERSYLPGYEEPAISYQLASEMGKNEIEKGDGNTSERLLKIVTGIILIVVMFAGGAGFLAYKRAKARRRRRRRRNY